MSQKKSEIPFSGIGVDEGLSWSWHLDLEALLTALSEPAPWNRPSPVASRAAASGSTTGDRASGGGASEGVVTGGLQGPDEAASDGEQAVPADSAVDLVEADFAEYLDAVDSGRSWVVPLPVAAGRVAEVLPTGPDLAGWLACGPAGDLDDGALAGAADGYRKLAGGGHAGEQDAGAELATPARSLSWPPGPPPRTRPAAPARTAARSGSRPMRTGRCRWP
jgi:hypothetical protein